MSKISKLVLLMTMITLIGCSSAGSSTGYGPRGEGFIGSAYGYKDKKITPDSWMIDYVDVNAARAKQGAKRRADEICISKGFAGANFKPELGVDDRMIVARGLADCLKPSKIAKPNNNSESKRLIARVKEIDVEIAAYENEIASTKKSSPLTGNAAILGGLINSFAASSLSSRIAELKAERFGIMKKLKNKISK